MRSGHGVLKNLRCPEKEKKTSARESVSCETRDLWMHVAVQDGFEFILLRRSIRCNTPTDLATQSHSMQ